MILSAIGPALLLGAAFGTFMLFLLLGVLALPVTAALDKVIGKEKGLLLYAGAVFLFTWFVLGGGKAGSGTASPGREDKVRAPTMDVKGDPFARPDLLAAGVPGHGDRRNMFRRSTDTSPLPPPDLAAPPWHPLVPAVPPTVPGPAPGARWVLEGPRPTIDPSDTSTIAPIPDVVFADRGPLPEEVYDAIETPAGKEFVYAVGVNDGSGWLREGDPGFDDAIWRLANAPPEERAKIELRAAIIGSARAAAAALDPASVLKKKRENIGIERKLNPQTETFRVRETVDNRFRAAIEASGLTWTSWRSAKDVSGLRRVAEKMAQIGRTGQDAGLGWARAAEALEVALVEANRVGDTARCSEILLELLAAYRARHDEAALFRTLSSYVRGSPARPDGWTWIGDLVLERMGEPEEAIRYYDRAIEVRRAYPDAHVGKARALAWLGRHEEALATLESAGSEPPALALRAVTLLRLGRLDRAKSAVDALLARDGGSAEAIHLRGCVLYAQGELASARSAFERAATMSTGAAVRAQACYGLGLTAVRLGQGAAARAAFEAAEKALAQGSDPGPTPDEIVAPSFGLAYLAWCENQTSALSEHLSRARVEAPRSCAIEFFAGLIAATEGNFPSALRAFNDAQSRAVGGYPELDGWLGRTYMALGENAAESEADPAEVAAHFERALAFLGRAADREEARTKGAFGMRLRQALAASIAVSTPRRRRFLQVKELVDRILQQDTLREQPAALAVRGYAWFQLGADDETAYDECLRDFQHVKDKVKDDPADPWFEWLDYARSRLDDVKYWRSLEEKRVAFEGVALSKDWEQIEGNDIAIRLDEGQLVMKGERARKDGRLDDPIVAAATTSLFTKRSFEEVSFRIAIPGEVQGRYRNNNTFGAQVLVATRGGGRGRSAAPGIGVFNDRGRVALRIGGGRNETYKDGEIHRLLAPDGSERMWPTGESVHVRIVRVNGDEGTFNIYLNDEPLFDESAPESISGLRRAGGDLQLWIGGFSTQAQPYDVTVSELRVIRQKGDR